MFHSVRQESCYVRNLSNSKLRLLYINRLLVRLLYQIWLFHLLRKRKSIDIPLPQMIVSDWLWQKWTDKNWGSYWYLKIQEFCNKNILSDCNYSVYATAARFNLITIACLTTICIFELRTVRLLLLYNRVSSDYSDWWICKITKAVCQ